MSDELIKKEMAEVPTTTGTVTPPAQRQVDFSQEIEKLLPTVGTASLTKEEDEILFSPVDESLVEVRPDGLIYLSWMHYVTRLRRALGISWGLIPQMLPRVKDGLMVRPFWFLIRGTLVSEVIGEQTITSSTMTWGEAAEACRSNALMRACKGLGVTLELWDPAFIRNWKEKYAIQIPDPKHPEKTIWAKRESLKKMTPDQAVDETKKVFPGSEVVPDGPTGSSDGAEKVSALLFSDWHDEIIRLNHYGILKQWWEEHREEAENRLHPNHWTMLVQLKDKLRKELYEKIVKEKGGK